MFFSQVTWLIVLLLYLLSFFRDMTFLQFFICPIAFFSIGLAVGIPETHLIDTRTHLRAFWHVCLALLVLSTMGIAAIQALVMAFYHANYVNRDIIASPPNGLP
jgi:ABC-type uncharacterized transport system permease subunit